MRARRAGSARTGALLAVALAALGLALALALLDSGDAPRTTGAPDDEPQRSATPAVAKTGPEPDAKRTPAPQAPAPDEHAGTPAPDSDLALTGTVVDGQARPIAGAVVIAVEKLGAGFAMLAESRHTEERARETTGAAGRFALTVPFARRLTLRVRADGYAAAVVEPCYGGEDREIALTRGATLVGRITDELTGDPVGGVVLDGWVREARGVRFEGISSADGAYRIDDLPAGTLVFDVTPPEHEARLREQVEARAGEIARRDVTLRRGGVVHGTVTDAATGLPIPGAEISAGWTFEKVARTDRAGQYRMQGAPGPGVPDMHARAPGYAKAVEAVSGDGEQRVDFALSRAGSVRGRIVDPAGAACGGVYVAASADLGVLGGIGRSDWQFTRSRDNGMFRIQGLVPGGLYTLFVRHRGRATRALHLPGQVDPDREIDVGDLVLEPPAVLLGRVVDGDGHGIAGARVDLRGTGDGCDRLLGSEERGQRRAPYHASNRDAEADADGGFRFADLAAGSYELSATVPGGPRGKLEGVRVDAGRTVAGVTIAVDLGASLAGTVVTADDAPLPPHVSVRIRRADDERDPGRSVSVTPDGGFRVLGLDAGRYRVETMISRWANEEAAPWIGAKVDDVAAGREDVRLVIHPAAFVSGIVVGAGGAPRKGIAVLATSTGTDRYRARDATDDEGRFRIPVPRGSVVDLRYGEPPPSDFGIVLDPKADTAQLYPGAKAGASGIALQLK